MTQRVPLIGSHRRLRSRPRSRSQLPTVSTAIGEPRSQVIRNCCRAPRTWSIRPSVPASPVLGLHRDPGIPLVGIEGDVLHGGAPPLCGDPTRIPPGSPAAYSAVLRRRGAFTASIEQECGGTRGVRFFCRLSIGQSSSKTLSPSCNAPCVAKTEFVCD